MNENESMNNISTNDDENSNIPNKKEENSKSSDVTVDRDFIPDTQETVPPTPDFSDGFNATTEKTDNNVINIPIPDYSKLFQTYKQLFENVTEDIDDINKRFTKIAELIDNNTKETNAAIKATQIYSKLFTKLSLGINVVLLIAIIILFIIK